jgi:hypothetical protein
LVGLYPRATQKFQELFDDHIEAEVRASRAGGRSRAALIYLHSRFIEEIEGLIATGAGPRRSNHAGVAVTASCKARP